LNIHKSHHKTCKTYEFHIKTAKSAADAVQEIR